MRPPGEIAGGGHRRRLRGALDYGVQVRLFALLLFLFLLALLLGTMILFGQARLRLEAALEEKLRLAGQMAVGRLRAEPGWQGGALSPEAAAFLERLRAEAGLSRVALWEEGTVVGTGAWRPDEALLREARQGRPVLSGFYAEGGGYRKALYLPVREPGGAVLAALAVEAPADFLGFVHRIRWVVFGGYGVGLLLAITLSVLFIRSILAPYARMRSAARTALGLEGPRPEPEAVGEVEFVIRTFEQMIRTLQAKEAELQRLYAGERQRSRNLESYQEYILGGISSGVVSVRPDLTITVFNRTAQQIFGLAEGEVLGRPLAAVFGLEARLTRLAQEAVREGRVHSRLEFNLRRPDGTPISIGLSSSLLRNEAGELVGLTFLLTDLTEVLALREQVMLKESLATLGEMSAGIAHEFRNSLGAILGFARLLEQRTPPDDPRAPHIQTIITELRGVEGILKDFLAFAKPAQLSLGDVDLTELVEETLGPYHDVWEAGTIKLQRRLPPGPLVIQADGTLLKQALTNVVRNAIEAMPDGGELTVAIRVRELEEGERGRGQIEIAVRDTGPGIPAEDLERIFTPFFTTKPQGTGLGLALAQKAIVSHGGRVTVASQVGAGSTFTLILPRGERRRAPRI